MIWHGGEHKHMQIMFGCTQPLIGWLMGSLNQSDGDMGRHGREHGTQGGT